MNIPLKFKTNKEQLIYICLKLIEFEIREQYKITKRTMYIRLNKNIRKMFNLLEIIDFIQLVKYCKESRDLVKLIDGNHYRIWLFFKIQQIILEL